MTEPGERELEDSLVPPILHNLRQRFERTTCACEECVTACKHKPGMLVPGDIFRIMHDQVDEFPPMGLMDRQTKFIEEHFEASEGALAVKDGEPFRIPTIVPKLTEQGCVFLKDDRCTIHEVSPFGCSHTDMHTTQEEGQRISREAMGAIMFAWRESGWYGIIWNWLDEQGHKATPLIVRQKNLSEAIDSIPASGE